MLYSFSRPLLLASLLCVVAPAFAQTAAPTPAPTRVAPLVSPEIHADKTVTFRLKAPDAQKVSMWGDWGKSSDLVKDESGIWSATVGPIAPDIYGYSFNVNGVTMIDPANTWTKPSRSVNTSVLDVPGAKSVPVDVLPWVPRGEVHLHDYNSTALGTVRRLRVYTPAGYDAQKKTRFPILYLLHGSGDNEAIWTEFGRANVILDNLIAAKKAVPMIVVMPDGHATMNVSRGQNALDFERDLLSDVMPLVESRYRVRADRKHRAIVGLSMGGNQSLLVGLKHRDLFAWVGGMSSAIREPVEPLASFWADPNSKKTPLRLLWIAIGRDDYLVKENRIFHAMLTDKKVPHEYIETGGGHTWTNWRLYLSALAPRLFDR